MQVEVSFVAVCKSAGLGVAVCSPTRYGRGGGGAAYVFGGFGGRGSEENRVLWVGFDEFLFGNAVD